MEWDERTDDRVWLSEAGRKGFTDVMDGTVFRPCCGDDGVDVLFAHEPRELRMDTNGDKDKRGTYLCFWRGRFWFTGVLDDLFE